MFNAESAWGSTEELWFNDWEFTGTPYDNRASYEKWSPHQYAKNFKTPTLVIHGQRDYRLDVSEGLQLFTTLQMEGVPSKMLYFPDEGHWVLKPQNSRLWYSEPVNDWVDQWTKKWAEGVGRADLGPADPGAARTSDPGHPAFPAPGRHDAGTAAPSTGSGQALGCPPSEARQGLVYEVAGAGDAEPDMVPEGPLRIARPFTRGMFEPASRAVGTFEP